MKKNLTAGLLICTFGLSGMNVSWATETVNIPPVIVQPYDLTVLKQQMMEQDRINRDQELAIQGLINDNQRLAQAALAQKQDSTLEKINQTMTAYRDSLYTRDQQRIADNSERASKYWDLIKLTEDVDDVKDLMPTLLLKKQTLADKYKMLTDLKDQMTALNDKLKGAADYQHYQETSASQEAKIQELTKTLAFDDQKISKYDAIIAQKDQEIAQLKANLTHAQDESMAKDAVIQEQKSTIAALQKAPVAANAAAVSPVVVNPMDKSINVAPIYVDVADDKDNIIKEKNEVIRHLNDALAVLKNQVQQPAAAPTAIAIPPVVVNGHGDAEKEVIIEQKNQAIDHLKEALVALQNQTHTSEQKDDLITQLKQNIADLKAAPPVDDTQKDQTIKWLNQVLASTKAKVHYYQVTTQQERDAAADAARHEADMKKDFALRFKEYSQYENEILTLKSRVGQMDFKLSQKNTQVDLLKSEIEARITYEKNQAVDAVRLRETIKNQVQDKEAEITKLKADMQAMQNHMKTVQADDRLQLAKQLVSLQEEEASLLEQIDDLEKTQNDMFDRHASAFEGRVKSLLADHQSQAEELKNRIEELTDAMDQKQEEVNTLKTGLENKISQEKNQTVLTVQIQDLQGQLRDKNNQIDALQQQVQTAQSRGQEADRLKQQLVDVKDQANQLQQTIQGKTSDVEKFNALIVEYQQKLEAKDNAYNEQLKQINELNARLQDRENQIATMKKNMMDLKEQADAQARDAQAKDLAMSMVQEKMTDEKVNSLMDANADKSKEITALKSDLALARQELQGAPSSDELTFLKVGLKKATAELKQKTDMLMAVKANADEYQRQYKDQSRDLQSLKQQFEDAEDDISKKDEDFKYKQMELTRFKERAAIKEGQMQDTINALSHKTGVVIRHAAPVAVQKKAEPKLLWGKSDAQKILILQEELRNANKEVQDMETQVNEFQTTGPAGEKLKQALVKIDQQGRVISALVQKLQDKGENVDITKL